MIYLGPSLEVEEATAILDADYRPPIKRGDIASLPIGTEVVGIVDGVLLTDAAVGHRELLSLLSRGVQIIGGGSMGALRAAELQDYGMIGVGRIFEEYASGRIDGDDEVVLAFDPFTGRPLSEPLINLRLNIEAAVERKLIPHEQGVRLIMELKRTYYPRRSYELLLSLGREVLGKEELEAISTFIKEEAFDYKREDAKNVIKAVKSTLLKMKKIN